MSKTREIPLTQGKVAIVDAADFAWLSQWKWTWAKCGVHRKARKGEQGYRGRGDTDTILMSRALLGITDSRIFVDHKDRDRLNHQRTNLRPATPRQNGANMARRSNNRSGVKGVVWDPARRKWAAFIKVNYKSIGLGRFVEKSAAAAAYAAAATRFFGEFARTDERR